MLPSFQSILCFSSYRNWYPSSFIRPTHTIPQFVHSFQHIDPGARLLETNTILHGRIIRKRESSKNLIFYDISQNSNFPSLQILSSRSRFNPDVYNHPIESDFDKIHSNLKCGDFCSFDGFPAKSKAGQLSLIPTQMRLLSSCLHDIPEQLTDPHQRFSNRSLDLLVNSENTKYFTARAQCNSIIRDTFESLDFLHVETPILSSMAGGAIATPFTTQSKFLPQKNKELYLRISPELYLKRLLIGGIDAVYEIGKQFRNEGLDATHNFEFSTCEAYKVGYSTQDFMEITQSIISKAAEAIPGERNGIDFLSPFKVLEIPQELHRHVGYLFSESDFNGDLSSQARNALLSALKTKSISVPSEISPAGLFDKVVGEFIEPLCVQPTFLTHQPVCMSPLAKSSNKIPGTVDRFELFIQGKEIANAYLELNNPQEQRERFLSQSKAARGDEDVHPMDENYCQALEYGLPPCSGWGIGIDRLVMLLTNQPHIREVVTFVPKS